MFRRQFHPSCDMIRREAQKEGADVVAAGRTVAKCSEDAEAKEKNGAGGDAGARRSEVCQITEVRDINDS